MTRKEAINTLKAMKAALKIYPKRKKQKESVSQINTALDMAIKSLSSDAIARAYNQGFVEGSVNATVNSNYVCPRCGEKMERKGSGDSE